MKVNDRLSLFRKRILIVDDEADVTFVLKRALTDNGFEQVDSFTDPLLALKGFRKDLYDLLILDVVMSQMDGFELYEEMKSIDNDVKVCFITAFEVNYQALRAVFPTVTSTDDLGCFIKKPVEIQQFIKHVREELDQTKSNNP
jgi:DNA-binding NtrC family response regulator